MRNRIGSALIFTVAAFLATGAVAQALPGKGSDPQQLWMRFEKELGLQRRFAADMEIAAMGMTMQSKIYRDGDKTRTDLTMPMMDMRMIALQVTENNRLKGYTLFPDRKQYCITPQDELDAAGKARAQAVEALRGLLGQ